MATDRIKNRWNQASRLVGSENFRHTVHTFMKRARNRRPRQRAAHAAAPSSAQFDEEDGFGSLGTSMSRQTPDWKSPQMVTSSVPPSSIPS